MPPLDTQHIVFLACVGLFTLVAAWSDLWLWKIPNKLTVPMFVLGLVYQTAFGGWLGLLDGIYSFLIGFGLFFLFWMMGTSGGGDVKLIGALSVWLGRKLLLPVLIATTVMVVVIHVTYLVWRLITGGFRNAKKEIDAARESRNAAEPREMIATRRRGKVFMGYALPVAVATWAVLLWKLPTL